MSAWLRTQSRAVLSHLSTDDSAVPLAIATNERFVLVVDSFLTVFFTTSYGFRFKWPILKLRQLAAGFKRSQVETFEIPTRLKPERRI